MYLSVNIKRFCIFLLLTGTIATFMPIQFSEVVYASADPNMPDDYLCYSGFESGTSISPASACWEENVGVTTYWVGSSGTNYMSSSDPKRGSRTMRLVKYAGTQRNCFTLFQTGSLFTTEFYTSGWYKLNTYEDYTWSVPWVFRNNYDPSYSEEVITFSPRKTTTYGGEDYWYAGHGTNHGYHTWQVYIYDDYVSESSWTNQGEIVVARPHEVPRGRWFRLEIYCKRSSSDGIFQVWITDPDNPDESEQDMRLILSVEGCQNSYGYAESGSSNYLCPFTKLYGGNPSGSFTLNADMQVDELYIYNYNAHTDIEPEEEPNPPNAGNPHTNTTIAGNIANISAISSCDTLFSNATVGGIYLNSWVVEHNSTGTPQNVTGYFIGQGVDPPALILTFDDSDPSLTSQALPIMNGYGFKGVACLNCTRSNTTAMAKECSDYGWEIASQTMTHAHLNDLDNASLYYEIQGSKNWIDQNINGSFPVITFTYPYGEGVDNSTVTDVVKQFYELARHAWGSDTWDGTTNWAIPVYAVKNDTYTYIVDDAITEAQDNHEYAVLMFHAIESPMISWGAITPTMFTTVLDEIQTSDLPVTTFKGAYLDSQTAMWSFILTLNSSVGTKIYFKAWVQDTLGQWSEPSIKYITTTGSQPSQPPYVNNLSYNTTTIAMPVNITSFASDDLGVSHWKWGTDNGSVSWSNSSWTPFGGSPLSSYFSFSFILNETTGTNIKIEVYINDTDNQESSSFIYLITTDYEAPKILSMTHNTTVWQSNILYKIKIEDPYGVVGLFFELNNTETPLNSTFQTVTYIGNNTYTWNSSSLGNDFSIINSVYGATIVYKAYINNTKGKWKVSQNLFFVSGGYHLWWTIKSKYGSVMDDYITWKLYNKTSQVQITYDEGWGTLWGEDYQLRIYYKGDLVRSEDYNMTTQDRSVTINLDALHMTNLAGFIVVNGSTSTLDLLQQDINYIRFNGTGAGTFLIKIDSIVSPIIIYRDSVEYGNWTYDSSNDVIDLIGSFSEYEIILPTPYLNPTIAPNAYIVPNMNTMTQYYFTQYLLINNMTIEGQALWIDNRWINATQATSNIIAVHNWFDGFGTAFTPSKNDRIYLNVTGKGAPSRVNGASYNYDAGTSILELNVTANTRCGVHWGSGGTSYLATPDIEGFGHSWGVYKSLYGFGLYLPEQGAPTEQRIFRATVYAKNGITDVTIIRLNIGSNILLEFNTTSQEFRVVSNPYDYFHLKEAICTSQYDNTRYYWNLDFGGTIPKYHPFMQLQNLTVTTTSTIEGSASNINYGAFFVYISQPPEQHLLPLPLGWVIPILGVAGIAMVMLSPYITVREVKRGKGETAFMWGLIVFVFGIALALAWLWS